MRHLRRRGRQLGSPRAAQGKHARDGQRKPGAGRDRRASGGARGSGARAATGADVALSEDKAGQLGSAAGSPPPTVLCPGYAKAPYSCGGCVGAVAPSGPSSVVTAICAKPERGLLMSIILSSLLSGTNTAAASGRPPGVMSQTSYTFPFASAGKPLKSTRV